MISFNSRSGRASLALVAFAALGAAHEAHAVGTDANTQVTNTATVNYTVGTVVQAPITATAQFRVDKRIDLTVTEVGAAATTPVTPNDVNQATTFDITNTGNSVQEFAVTGTNRPNGESLFTRTDNGDVANLRVFLDDGDGTYDAGDTQVTFVSINEDATVRVHVLADIPAGAPNGQVSNVRLTADATTAGSNGATPETESAADSADPNVVDVVLADSATGGQVARDGAAFADDQYVVVSAALSVTKTSTVFSDPINSTTNPKAIPGAVMTYTLTLANAAGAGVPATGVSLSDPIPANTAIALGAFGGAGNDIGISINGGAETYCTAAADADACSVAAGTLTVGSAGLGNIAPGANVVVRFRVTIN